MYKIYGKQNCTYCVQSKSILELYDIHYEYVDIEQDDDAMNLFIEKGWRTVPQIYKGETYIGGFDQLKVNMRSLIK